LYSLSLRAGEACAAISSIFGTKKSGATRPTFNNITQTKTSYNTKNLKIKNFFKNLRSLFVSSIYLFFVILC